jgi:hypothetical protein
MAKHIASIVCAVFVPWFITVLSTTMSKHQWVKRRLFKVTAVARVLRHLVFCIRKVAVRTSPAVKGKHLLGHVVINFNVFIAAFVFVLRWLVLMLFTLFIGLFTDVLLQTFVELLDPTLDAAKVEGLAALLAIPSCATLVNLVLADYALLVAGRQGLDEEYTLLGQVAELTQKIFVVVFYFCSVFQVWITFFEKLQFFWSIIFKFLGVVEVLGC